MRLLNSQDALFLKETLESCKTELEELVREKEWYSTEVLDMVEASLEIMKRIGV